ncbi:molybdopterin synthase catalytic subunit [Flavimobilis soli]|uniref:Molybdopterin synthase catalytic subunit n=1 Tax=Flavimobilis soli TaxID=442709 RepID=A0A2A9ECW8_9MICO|nr:molybdenum cofactor biosynthesis protein MoaE [Flavimobilis soli]PFG36778.1 molybdopterin synthase catalytic subunit [Flavimobilis soli]
MTTAPVATAVRLARVTDAPLSIDAHIEAVRSSAAGAVATFIGQVRDHDPSVVGEVVGLEYSAHPDAERILAEVAARVAAPGTLVAISHRTGLLDVGGLALVAAVSAAHRRLAFETCEALVEGVKVEIPVWKREILRDGTYHWVGL